MDSDPLVTELVDVVGRSQVLVDDDVRAPYEHDWTGRFAGRARAVVRPATADEVAAVLGACARSGAAVVPQGGNTGLVGGGAPADGEVVLSTRRLDTVGAVDTATAQVTVGAGTTLGALQELLVPLGLQLGVDLASRHSATLGGMAATNAGGTRVLRHGTMRARVVGAEAALSTGTLVQALRALPKDTSGYDLAGLLVGSEGTLGVFTALRLALDPAPRRRAAALVGLTSLSAALDLAVAVHRRLATLESAEVLDAATVELVARSFDLPDPMGAGAGWYLVLGGAGGDDQAGALVDALAAATGTAGSATAGSATAGNEMDPVRADAVVDAVVADEGARLQALWRYREDASEALARAGPPRKLDVSLPLGSLVAFAAEAPALVGRAAPSARLHLFGHLLDGNLHCNVLAVPPDRGDAVDEALLELAVALGGSIGAEHGIGRAKRRYLGLVRTPAEVGAFRAIKAALDPAGIRLGAASEQPDRRSTETRPPPRACTAAGGGRPRRGLVTTAGGRG